MSKEIYSRIENSAELCPIWSMSAANEMGKIVDQCRNSDLLLTKISSTRQSIPIKAGYAAETLHTETFNLDAILKDKEVRAFTDKCVDTPLPLNDRTNDIVVMRGEEKVHGAQLKYYQNGEKTADAFRDTRDGVAHYKEADSLIGPSDQLDDIKAQARRTELKTHQTRPDVSDAARDVQEKATDRLKHEGVESRPLSKKEAEVIAVDDENGKGAHRKIQNDCKNQSTVQQSLNAAKSAAIITTVIAGTINTISCLNKVQKGEMSTGDAVSYILKNTAIAASDTALKASAGTAAVSLTARAIPEFFTGSMLQSTLSSGSIAGAAICAVDLVECLVMVAAGKMTLSELETRSGKNLFQTATGVSGASIGAAIGVPAGPAGILIGSLVGGMITSVATTVAIENHIEKSFRETMDNTARIVKSEQVMLNSIDYFQQSQDFFAEFRLGCARSEQNFAKQMDIINQYGLLMNEKINNI